MLRVVCNEFAHLPHAIALRSWKSVESSIWGSCTVIRFDIGAIDAILDCERFCDAWTGQSNGLRQKLTNSMAFDAKKLSDENQSANDTRAISARWHAQPQAAVIKPSLQKILMICDFNADLFLAHVLSN